MLHALAVTASVRRHVELPAQNMHGGIIWAEPSESPSASQVVSPSSVAGLSHTSSCFCV